MTKRTVKYNDKKYYTNLNDYEYSIVEKIDDEEQDYVEYVICYERSPKKWKKLTKSEYEQLMKRLEKLREMVTRTRNRAIRSEIIKIMERCYLLPKQYLFPE